MLDREYVWTDEGLDNASRNGVGVDETTQALYAPSGLCDRIGGTSTYKIIGARALRGADLDEWRRRVL